MGRGRVDQTSETEVSAVKVETKRRKPIVEDIKI